MSNTPPPSHQTLPHNPTTTDPDTMETIRAKTSTTTKLAITALKAGVEAEKALETAGIKLNIARAVAEMFTKNDPVKQPYQISPDDKYHEIRTDPHTIAASKAEEVRLTRGLMKNLPFLGVKVLPFGEVEALEPRIEEPTARSGYKLVLRTEANGNIEGCSRGFFQVFRLVGEAGTLLVEDTYTEMEIVNKDKGRFMTTIVYRR